MQPAVNTSGVFPRRQVEISYFVCGLFRISSLRRISQSIDAITVRLTRAKLILEFATIILLL